MKKPLKFFSNVICRIAIVYILHNIYHDKYYIGQSTNGGDRMFDHSSDLTNNRHRNSGLQNDFNLLKKLNKDPFKEITCEIYYFKPIIHYIPNSLEFQSLKRELITMERNLIDTYKKKGKYLYNANREKLLTLRSTKLSKTMKKAINARPCIISGQHFPSVLAVSIAYSCTTETVKRRLDDPENDDWKYANTDQHSPSLIKKVRFHDPISNKTHNFSSMVQAHKELKILISQDVNAYHNARVYASPKAIVRYCNNPKNKRFQWITSENELNDY